MLLPSVPIPDTLKGVDDLIHAGFEAYRGSCFDWLLAATGLVVVGLFLEGPELWYEITSIVRHRRFTHRFHFSLPEDHVRDWAKLAAFAGWLFIVVGVAGEYVADSFVSKADGYVQTFDEILLTEAQRESAHAEATARGFDAQIAASNAKAKSAEATAKKFEATITEAQRDAAESKKEAESERLARVKLEKELQPRRLSSKQIDGLADRLKPLSAKGRMNIVITSATLDAESDDFAKDFETAFKAAGWKTARVRWNQTGERGLDVGMLPDPTAPEQIPAAFASLVQSVQIAIISEGIRCRIVPLSPDAPISLEKPEKNVLYLLVGFKPEPLTNQK
jgi:hypothetical protein